MENGPFEDVFPIKPGNIPASYVRKSQRVNELTWHLKMDGWNTLGMAYFQGRAVKLREGKPFKPQICLSFYQEHGNFLRIVTMINEQ